MDQATPTLPKSNILQLGAPAKRSERIALGFIIGLQHLLAFSPILLAITVYTLSWRIGAIIGHWPIAWVDDPKYSAPNDILSSVLYCSTLPLLLLSVAAVVVLPAVTLTLWRRVPRLWSLFLIVLWILGFILVRLDPGDRFLWFMD